MNQQVTVQPVQKEDYWKKFRSNVVGQDLFFENEYGKHQVLYADWIASGRLYAPIEHALTNKIGKVVANPHSYSSYTGAQITACYQEARKRIKRHVNASGDDVLVTVGAGMSAALLRLQDILGLRQPATSEKPVVFITHMEHHSNHVSWMECGVDVVVLEPDQYGQVSVHNLRDELEKYKDRKLKLGAFSACSNVTGIINPIHQLAKVMHEYEGYCMADFAASAPYVAMDMHPPKLGEHLDAICFSPHKFLGGPGSCGILIFNKKLHNGTPSVPGGGNVRWTDPWGGYGFTSDTEAQEDGGTPGFIQTIKASMAIALKEKMGVKQMGEREGQIMDIAFEALSNLPNVSVLASDYKGIRIGAIAFNIEGLHYNLVVRLLNDRFGIQVRGGWSCASTYAYQLFGADKLKIQRTSAEIDAYDASNKPGWVRLSLHPTMAEEELMYCLWAIKKVSLHGERWGQGMNYNPRTNEYEKEGDAPPTQEDTKELLFNF